MFLRILWKLLGASRGRLAVALIALTSGAAVCSALLNVNLDAERKLTQEFRTLGANVVIAPPAGGSEAALADAAVLDRIAALRVPQIVATAPYLYVAANSGSQPVILAGTWFDQVAKMNSWWKLEGGWVSSRDDHEHCLVGFTAARQLGLAPGSSVQLRSGDRNISLTVAGIVTTGGAEDNQILTNLDSAQALAGLSGRVSLVQLSVSGTPAEIEEVTRTLADNLPGLDVRPVRQIAAAEGTILGRIQRIDFLDHRADSGSLDARSAGVDGGSGDGAPAGRRPDEGARRDGAAHHAFVSRRSRHARRGGRPAWFSDWRCAGPMDWRAHLRRRHFGAL